MAADLNWELTILEVVQGFYLQLLSEAIQEEVAPPAGLEEESLCAGDRDAALVLPAMRSWLKLLDMAITPEMLRRSLTSAQDPDLAEILLCYFARKQSKSDLDRDKADFIATYLYRNPRVPGQWATSELSVDTAAPFETALKVILNDAEPPELSSGELRMMDEFESLAGEAENVHHFDRLIESGLIAKARRIKHGFGPTFYHPRALAVIAPYNERVGRRFSELFAAAAQQVKSYAKQIQRRGGNLSSRVDGDITVQQLSQVEEKKILGIEYGRAQEYFQQVSRLKKAVDARNLTRAVDAAVAATPIAPAPREFSDSVRADSARAEEESRIQSVEKSIRIWVRSADEHCRHIVPMPFGRFVLQPQEAVAYGADFAEEKSFRGDNARALIRMVAIMARLLAEGEEFRQNQDSSHLWRRHAEALALLEEAAAEAFERAGAVLELASQRGLAEKARLLTATIDRLRSQIEESRELLSAERPKASGE